jgi:hypothetical protein
LIFAQVLAYKVHVFEYGLLAAFRDTQASAVQQAAEPTAGRVGSAASPETVAGDKTASHVARAKQMFNDIIKNHAGTPWAARANGVKRGFGVSWWRSITAPWKTGPPGPPLPPILKL